MQEIRDKVASAFTILRQQGCYGHNSDLIDLCKYLALHNFENFMINGQVENYFLVAFKLQWNLDFTIWQGDSKIISLDRNIVVND